MFGIKDEIYTGIQNSIKAAIEEGVLEIEEYFVRDMIWDIVEYWMTKFGMEDLEEEYNDEYYILVGFALGYLKGVSKDV